MEILSVNADQDLINVASAIGRNPQSWKGWACLYVDLSAIESELYWDCLVWTKSLIESYLKDAEGRTYFCNQKSIHILCKGVEYDALSLAAQQICGFVHAQSQRNVECMVLDLASEGVFYAQNVFEQTENIFSMPDWAQDSMFTSFIEEEEPCTVQTPPKDATKVLLVEDDPVTRWMVRNALKQECEFASAGTGNKAFSMYSSFQPDIVFLDINLPDKNGYEILEWIMRNDPGACVVMFSSNDNMDNITSAMEEGASGFIAKPFAKDSLLHYIHAYTG